MPSTARLLTLRLALIAMLVAACQAQSPLPGREARRVDLENRDLISSRVEFQREPVVLVPGPQFGTATLIVRFGQTRLGATGGCNWYGAEGWSVVDGTLTIDEEMGGELMACDASSESQDRWLIDLLSGAPQVRVDGERVLLIGGDNVVTFLDTDVDEL